MRVGLVWGLAQWGLQERAAPIPAVHRKPIRAADLLGRGSFPRHSKDAVLRRVMVPASIRDEQHGDDEEGCLLCPLDANEILATRRLSNQVIRFTGRLPSQAGTESQPGHGLHQLSPKSIVHLYNWLFGAHRSS